MKTLFHNLLLTLCLGALVLTSSVGFAYQQTDLVAAQRQYDQTVQERQRSLERLQGLEDRYQGLVQKIDKLKSNGAIGTIGGRIELQNLLTQSKAIADELDGLQTKVRAMDNRLAGQRSTLVGGIDQRLMDLERSLGSASASSRKAIVGELNELRRRRSSYTTPLPAAPSSREVDSALRLAEDAAHPDELMAAADELQDTEDQLRKRLSAIESKLSDLRKSRALTRRARSFTREEKFFEETDRDRVIARYEKVTVNTPNTPAAQSDDNGATVTSANDNQGSTGAPESTNEAGGNNAFDADGMTAPANDVAMGAADPGTRTNEPSLSDSPTGASVATPQDPFASSRETIVIDGGMDPSRAVGSIGGSSSDLEGQIQRLEKEQKKLKKQANSLRKRAKELRERADEM